MSFLERQKLTLCSLRVPLSNDPPQPPKKGTGKKVASAPGASKAASKSRSSKNPILEKRPKNFGIGAVALPFCKSSVASPLTRTMLAQARTSSRPVT